MGPRLGKGNVNRGAIAQGHPPGAAGGILARTDDNLHAWIANAPGIKSGTVMPRFADTFTPQQIDDLVAYLATLK